MSRRSSTCSRTTWRSWRRCASCGPRTRTRSSSSRRVFGDGRTRAYAWGRAAAREDVAAAVERVVAMSGQFEQRRLARPSYQLEVLDRFCGEEQLRRRAEAGAAWRELLAARRRHEELTENAALAEARLAELRALVEDTEGMEPGDEERLRAERERLRHVSELAEGAAAAATALAPDEGDGASGLVGDRRAGDRAARAARAGARTRPATSCATPSCGCARSRPSCTRFSRRSRPSRAGWSSSRPSSTGSPRRGGASAARRPTSCSRGRRRLAPSSPRSTAAPIPQRRRRRRSPTRRPASTRSRRELRAERNAAAPGLRRRGRVGAARRRHGRGRVPRRAARTRPGRDRRGRRGVPRSSERGPSVRAGRRDRVGRRAVADRARDRRGRRRRDARLRRDRRRHRRGDRQRRRPRRCGASPSARR